MGKMGSGILDSGCLSRIRDPGSGNGMFIPDPGSWIRNVYPGSAALILALKILDNAIMKNIQMTFNFVTLLIYPLHCPFMGVFNFVIQEPSVNKQEET